MTVLSIFDIIAYTTIKEARALPKKYITQDTLKKKNLADILLLILEKRQTTRREIEYETGFSWGTVSSNVTLLLEKEYITEEKSERSAAAGRSTYTLKPCGNKKVGIGIDICRSGFTCEVVGIDFVVKKKLTAEFGEAVQSKVIGRAEELCREAALWCEKNGMQPIGIGIAGQGYVDGKLGIYMNNYEVPDWKPCNIKRHFENVFNLPVYLGHDPKCMLIAEMTREKYDDCVLVRLDDGIGMSVALDGRIIDDTERFELGHTVIEPDGKLCVCGKRGCVEAYCSRKAIAEAAGVLPNEISEAPEKYREFTVEAGKRLALPLHNICVIFNPKKLIFTGTASRITELTDEACAYLDKSKVTVKIKPEVSAAYGAAVESIRTAISSFDI